MITIYAILSCMHFGPGIEPSCKMLPQIYETLEECQLWRDGYQLDNMPTPMSSVRTRFECVHKEVPAWQR